MRASPSVSGTAWFAALLGLLFALVVQCHSATAWSQKSLVKQVELGGSVAQFQWDIIAKSSGEEPEYATMETIPLVVYLSRSEENRLSSIRASVSSLADKKESKRIAVERGGALEGDDDTYWYAAEIPKDLAMSGAELRVRVVASILHDADPLPKSIRQAEKQMLLWTGDVSLRTPYATAKGSVVIKTPGPQILSYEPKDDAKQEAKTITYGPYKEVPAYVPGSSAVTQGRVHYEFDRPVITYVNFDRHVEVSHWGDNLATADTIWMRNDGPTLKGQFSRAKHMVNMWSNPTSEIAAQIHSVPVMLPPASSDAYFVDAAGNVSSSALSPDTPGLLLPRRLDLQPRFPLLGGWNYTFTVGWNQRMSAAGMAKRLPEAHRFRVAVPFLTAPNNVAVDHAKLRIVLPEGASNINLTLPFDMDSEHIETYPTYLDTVGRPAVILQRAKCTSKLNSFVYVDYTLSPLAHVRKILAVASAIALVFFIAA
ncbi:dolichyl-diphosphooligosaccharide--protein glycosyltransferase subunit 1 [Malassezia obtusa]|uniref:Dolichyl-diphosphooligosaccharide--protein glycosyltransferase subunit 1 n=1 Tax=Malassezia obtusa TaxID=76774 RepID=A0AAF0DZQ6_9BASI|nr:dolichyl-diphosphooligosaccharide--protein glycosyltransferase subunit 1 [Malassezia obtusa]